MISSLPLLPPPRIPQRNESSSSKIFLIYYIKRPRLNSTKHSILWLLRRPQIPRYLSLSLSVMRVCEVKPVTNGGPRAVAGEKVRHKPWILEPCYLKAFWEGPMSLRYSEYISCFYSFTSRFSNSTDSTLLLQRSLKRPCKRCSAHISRPAFRFLRWRHPKRFLIL